MNRIENRNYLAIKGNPCLSVKLIKASVQLMDWEALSEAMQGAIIDFNKEERRLQITNIDDIQTQKVVDFVKKYFEGYVFETLQDEGAVNLKIHNNRNRTYHLDNLSKIFEEAQKKNKGPIVLKVMPETEDQGYRYNLWIK